MVKRLNNWPALLSHYLIERRSMPFEWGKNDCLTFMADGVVAITGEDPWLDWRGHSNEEEAQARLDFMPVGGWITRGFGYEPHNNVLKAQRGDAALVLLPQGYIAGLVDDSGERIACVAEHHHGLIRLPLRLAVSIWSY